MTTPIPVASSGAAWNAANRFPSRASSTRSSCETAAPRMTGIGGSESSSKHTARGRYKPLVQSDRLGDEARGSLLAEEVALGRHHELARGAVAADVEAAHDRRRDSRRLAADELGRARELVG